MILEVLIFTRFVLSTFYKKIEQVSDLLNRKLLEIPQLPLAENNVVENRPKMVKMAINTRYMACNV